MDGQENKGTPENVEGFEDLFQDDEDEREVVDVGLDISTSIVGLVVLNSVTGDLVSMDAIKLTGKKYSDVWVKATHVENELARIVDMDKYLVNSIFVEEAHMRFTPGFSSAKTLFSLSRFNGIVSFIAYKLFGQKPKMTNVRTARKHLGIKINYKDKTKDTKTKVFEAVKKINPHFPWAQHVAKGGKSKGQTVWSKHNFDMADAWVICEGGRRIANPSGKTRR